MLLPELWRLEIFKSSHQDQYHIGMYPCFCAPQVKIHIFCILTTSCLDAAKMQKSQIPAWNMLHALYFVISDTILCYTFALKSYMKYGWQKSDWHECILSLSMLEAATVSKTYKTFLQCWHILMLEIDLFTLYNAFRKLKLKHGSIITGWRYLWSFSTCCFSTCTLQWIFQHVLGWMLKVKFISLFHWWYNTDGTTVAISLNFHDFNMILRVTLSSLQCIWHATGLRDNNKNICYTFTRLFSSFVFYTAT